MQLSLELPNKNVQPALYAGSVLVFHPLYGIQLPMAFLIALRLRAYQPMLAGPQLITNPITVLSIWFALYQIGESSLNIIGIDTLSFNRQDLKLLIESIGNGKWEQQITPVISLFGQISLGSLIMGLFLGLILTALYRVAARYSYKSYIRLKERVESESNKP